MALCLFQVAVGCIMSGYQISTEFSQYVIAASFLPPSLNPIFFAVFLLEFREGYMAVLQFIPDKIVRFCKGLLRNGIPFVCNLRSGEFFRALIAGYFMFFIIRHLDRPLFSHANYFRGYRPPPLTSCHLLPSSRDLIFANFLGFSNEPRKLNPVKVWNPCSRKFVPVKRKKSAIREILV